MARNELISGMDSLQSVLILKGHGVSSKIAWLAWSHPK